MASGAAACEASSPRCSPSFPVPQATGPSFGRSLRDFECLEVLHTKPVRIVCRARCKVSGTYVALKVYNKRELLRVDNGVSGHLSAAQVRREIEMHGRLKHPGVCQLYTAFEDARTIVLVMELCNQGSLADRLECGELPEAVATRLLAQLFSAVRYIHSCGILHRDISPGNILFSDDGGSLKIADFGLAVDLSRGQPTSSAGTLYYCAPEVIRPLVDPSCKTFDYGFKADVWSCGVIAYEILTGLPLYDDELDDDVLSTRRKIAAGQPVLQPIAPGPYSLVTSALQVDPAARASIEELASNQWLCQAGCDSRQSKFAPRLIQALSSCVAEAIKVSNATSGTTKTSTRTGSRRLSIFGK